MDNNDKYGEKELFARIAQGDAKAFEQAHDLYKSRLIYYAMRFVDDGIEAQDILSEAFLALWKSRDNIRSDAHLRNFLFITVRHKALNYLEAKRRHTRLLDQMGNEPTVVDTADPDEVQVEIMHFLSEAVKSLPDDYRRIFELSFDRQFSPGEIARMLEMNPSTVRSRKQRAVEMIKEWVRQKLPLIALLTSYLRIFIAFF